MENIPTLILSENQRFASLIKHIEQIGDPRINRRKKHKYTSIIIMALCAMIGGADNYTSMAIFAQDRKHLFNQFLDLPHGIPSHDTFNRVLSKTNSTTITHWLLLWQSEEQCQFDKYVHIDGKMHKALKSRYHMNIVHAWGAQTGSVINQVRVPRESNEIVAVPMLLKHMTLTNKVVTADALNTQKNIVRLIVEKGGDYILPVKANQHQFFDDLKLFMDDVKNRVFKHIPVDYYQTFDKGHGRTELRRCWATNVVDWLYQKTEWRGLYTIIVVESICRKKWGIQHSCRYFISSLPPRAKKALEIIRSHWHIENRLHWHLDTDFNEDRSTVRDSWGAQNINLLRCLSLSLLIKSDSKRSIKDRRALAAFDFSYLLKTLLSRHN